MAAVRLVIILICLQEDRIFGSVSVAQKLVEIAAADLDERFSLLSISLAQRTLPPTNPSSLSNPSPLSNFVPVTALPISRYQGPDPLGLAQSDIAHGVFTSAERRSSAGGEGRAEGQ